jgi:hypothetical protein
MDGFFVLTRRIPQQDVCASCEDFDEVRAEKTPWPVFKQLKDNVFLKLPELGFLAFELCREKLMVFIPCRFSLLVEDQIPGVQTIPSNHDTL